MVMFTKLCLILAFLSAPSPKQAGPLTDKFPEKEEEHVEYHCTEKTKIFLNGTRIKKVTDIPVNAVVVKIKFNKQTKIITFIYFKTK